MCSVSQTRPLPNLDASDISLLTFKPSCAVTSKSEGPNTDSMPVSVAADVPSKILTDGQVEEGRECSDLLGSVAKSFT
jgi:hypothetical protein